MASLDSLPGDLIILIGRRLQQAGHPIAPLASTSKQLQAWTEGLIFHSLKIRSSRVAEFRQALTPVRFSAIRYLDYYIERDGSLEAGASNESSRVSAETCAIYSRVFTTAITDLLTMLQEKSSGTSHPGISLTLSGQCFSKALYLTEEYPEPQGELKNGREDGVDDGDDESRDDSSEYSDDDEDIEAQLRRESRLRQAWVEVNEDILPDGLLVPIVTTLCNIFDPKFASGVSPESWSILMKRFPGLKDAELIISDGEQKASVSRKEARNAFGLSTKSLPRTLTDAHITFHSHAPSNQLRTPPCFADPALGHDILSHQLGILSQQLVTIEIHQMTADLKDFFACSATSQWPVLQKLIFLELQPASADGTWYFDLRPGINMDDYLEEYGDPDVRTFDELRLSHREEELPPAMDHPVFPFRTDISPAKFKTIYLAAAEAAKRMPKLQVLQINFEDKGDAMDLGRSEHEFRYAHGITYPGWYKGSIAKISVGWALPRAVEIDYEVLDAWKGVGESRNASVGFHRWDVDAYEYNYQDIEVP